MRAHHYSLQVLTVLHTRRCSVFPKLYPIPKLFLFLPLSFCLSALPCHPQFETLPLKTLSGLAFLVCLSYLSVLFRSLRPGVRRHFSLFLSIPTPIYHETDRIVVVSSPRPYNQKRKEKKKKRKKREFTSIAASDQTEKSRCICIIVHTIQYIYTITPFVVVVFSTTTTTKNQKPKPAPPLPCHKSKEQRKAKKEGSTQFHLVTAPGLPLYLFRSHSLPFWEVAQVQYIYTYYDARKNLHVDSLLPG